jgi:hypothetical protein
MFLLSHPVRARNVDRRAFPQARNSSGVVCMQSRHAAFVAALSLFALARCECENNLNRVAPKIEIADPFDASVSVCADQGIRECAYDFGNDIPIGQARFFQFVIKNPSPVDLVLKDISFSGDSDPAFTLAGEIPEGVSAQLGDEGEIITVQFTPSVESQVTARLVISSDAANLDPEEDVVIVFTGSGVDLGGPEISISPTTCDFGSVGVGVTAFCDLTVENVGQRELLVTSIAIDPTNSIFGPSGVFPIPTAIQPGTGVSLRLYATPASAGETTGTLLVGSTDPNNAEVAVPLTVFGAQAPTAVAEVESVNGNPPAADPTVRPLDDVVLTGVNSQPALAGGSIVGYVWEIVQQPAESSVALSTPNQMTTGFFFSSGSGNLQGLDVAGTFIVKLTVQDDQGLFSTNEATVTLNAVPSEALHVQLTWDKPVNDIDLHLIKGSGPYCSDQSCYWANCKVTSSSHPEWDGQSGRSAGDPSLDVDDLSGFGPENINVDLPVDDTYTTAVHFFSGSQSTATTVKIFVNGGLAYESTVDLQTDDDFWEVAQVQWSNGGAIVAPIDNYSNNWSCPFGP